ncbi:MAG: hydrogenase, partial [Erysipelotrichia bacterium]|nr:hydrogenase [Erysipelotrichia bacterium]
MINSADMVKKVFTQKSGRIETNKGEAFYNNLFAQSKKRLADLRAQEPLKDIDLMEIIESEGVNRRDFLKWVSATTATLMLPPMFAPLVAEATELMNRVPVIWIELQDCAGNSEALLRSAAPTVDDLLFDVLSLEFHETLQAAAGHDADKQLEEAAHHFKDKYLLFVEGAIPMAMNGQYGTIGAMGETFH